MGTFPDPASSLLAFFALAALAAVVFWPGRGIVPRLGRLARLSERVRLEDAVKHIFADETAGRRPSFDSLAGAVGVTRDRAVEVVRHLQRIGLARFDGEAVELTGEGRAHALRLVRTHRIWERYLAERTGLGPGEWHSHADRLEHGVSAEDVERLAASMGNPLYDPHGDPIPTVAGALPPPRGVPLSSLPAGTNARVVHIEDEPEGIYRSLRNLGMNVGSLLRVEGIDAASVSLVVDGRRVTIERLAIRDLTVEPVEDGGAEEGLERLDALRPGEDGVVVRVGAQVQGAQRRRLLDLGVVPGTVVTAELSSISGDPMAYRIRGAVVALRRAQAGDIFIRRRPREDAA
ncbi:MAG: iron dependent repressor, metal binding and dimerization domain protein [Vicinamibacterales bacterium]